MRRACVLVLCPILLTCAPAAPAADVYRCSDAKGESFQDTPCRTTQTQRRVHLPDDPAQTSPPARTTDVDATPSTAAPAVVVDAPPRIPPPAFFLCMRHDGSVYLSEDGIGGRSAVPLGMLGFPSRSLADAYGGQNGIGVSAPGLRPIPHLPSSQAPFAGEYVWIEDACHAAAPAEACGYLRGELDTLESKLRRAFSDDAPQLQQEEKTVRERLRGC